MIQIFKPTYHVDECLTEIKECLETGWTGLGGKTIEFENAWRDYTGYNFAHFLNSATAGLHLAFNILKKEFLWKDGDEVISTSNTFISSNHAILYENLKPVFANINESMCMDFDDFKSKITDKTVACLFVGIGGNLGDYNKIKKYCDNNDIVFILDAAHMAGSRYEGKIIGLDSIVSIYSFQAVKNLPTCDGGMICFNDEYLDKKARQLAWMGITKDTFQRTSGNGEYKWKYDVNDIGFKYHGNAIAAAIGKVQLKYLDEDNEYRRKLANRYMENLKGKVPFVEHLNKEETSQHLFQIFSEDREALIFNLKENDINCGVHYVPNSDYIMYDDEFLDLEQTKFLTDRVLSLPLHLQLSIDDVDFISENVIKGINLNG